MDKQFWAGNDRDWNPGIRGAFPRAGAPPAGEGACGAAPRGSRALRSARLLHNIGGHPQAWGVLNRVFSATVMYELYPGKTPTILTE